MLKFIVLFAFLLLAACGAPAPSSEASVQLKDEGLTYSATMQVKTGTTCNPTSSIMQLLGEPSNPNPYLTQVRIAKSTSDSGYWQNASGFQPYTATSIVTAAEYAADCAVINAPGKRSQVTFYWDGSNCPNGHCVETQSPVLTNL